MFGISHNDSDTTYGALIDIGSGTIGVAFVVSKKSEPLPHLIYTNRMNMRLESSIDGRINLRRVREQLLTICLTLTKEGQVALGQHDPKAKITELYITCSSPWAFTLARNVHYESEHPFEITQSILHDLVHSAEEEILSHVRNDQSQKSSDFEVVESATVDIKVNDYLVKNPLELEGVSLELSHIIGLVPTDILNAVRDIQDKLFPESKIRAHTYMLVMYCVLRDLFPKMDSLCVIDITAEATEFGIIENGLLIENSFIPYGSNTLVRNIATLTKRPLGDIQSQCVIYAENPKAIPQNVEPVLNEYSKYFEEQIQDIMTRRQVHHDIIITAHQPYQNLFTPLLQRSFKHLLGKDVRIITIRPDLITEVTEGTTSDVYLALSARFFHKLQACGE